MEKKLIKRILHEVSGISSIVRDWAEILTNETINGKKIIKGKDIPELYGKFKVDKWVINYNNSGNAEYDENKSGYENDVYVVYFNFDSRIITQLSKQQIQQIFNHEIKHAYQDWQRVSKGSTPIRDTKEIKELYTKDFQKLLMMIQQGQYENPILSKIIMGYYYITNPEITAFIEGVYDDIHGSGDINQFQNQIKLVTQFKKPQSTQQLQKQWNVVLKTFDIPLFKKYPNINDFLNFTEKLFNIKGKYIMKKIGKIHTMEKLQEGLNLTNYSNAKNWFYNELNDMLLFQIKLIKPEDKYSGHLGNIYFYKKNKILMAWDKSTYKLNVHPEIWNLLNTQFNLNNIEIRKLIRNCIEDNYLITRVRPTNYWSSFISEKDWLSLIPPEVFVAMKDNINNF